MSQFPPNFSPCPPGRSHTLILAALSFLAGCLCAPLLENGVWLWALAVCGLGIAGLLRWLGLRMRPGIFLCLFALAVLHTHAAVQTPQPEAGVYEVTGYVSGGTRLKEDGRITFTLDEIALDGEATAGRAYCSLYYDEEPPRLFDGALIRVRGYVYLPQGKSGEPHLDFRMWMRQRGYSFGITFYDPPLVENSVDTAPVMDVFYRVRELLNGILEHSMGEQSRVASALLFGEKDGLSDEEYQSFQKLGIAHVMAVSGLHVAIIGTLISRMLKRTGMRKKMQLGITGVFLLFYCALTGFSAAAVRAAVMLIYYEMAHLCLRRVDRLTVLAGAMLIVLVIQPLSAHSAGFVLSFAAMLGIVLFMPAVQEGLDRQWPAFGKGKRFPAFWRGAKSMIALSLTAQLGVLIPTAAYYHQLPLYGVFINLLLVPLVSAVLLPLFALLLPLGMIPVAGDVLGWTAARCVDGLLGMVALLSKLPCAAIRVPSPGTLAGIGIGLAIVMLSRRVPGSLRRRLTASACILCITVGCAWMQQPDELRYIQLSVGQADSALLLDGKKTIVIDAGSDGQEAADYLLDECRDVDALFVTHLHMDHIGGAARLLDSGIRIKQVYLPQNAALQQADPAALAILERFEAEGIPVTELASGDELRYNQTAVRVLWPVRGQARSGHDANERPLVLAIDFDGYTILNMSDLPGIYEAYAATAADVLKVAHHGSSSGTSEEFLKFVSPAAALVSVSRGSRSLPGADTMERLYRHVPTVLRTNDAGDILLTVEDGALVVTPCKE